MIGRRLVVIYQEEVMSAVMVALDEDRAGSLVSAALAALAEGGTQADAAQALLDAADVFAQEDLAEDAEAFDGLDEDVYDDDEDGAY